MKLDSLFFFLRMDSWWRVAGGGWQVASANPLRRVESTIKVGCLNASETLIIVEFSCCFAEDIIGGGLARDPESVEK